MQSALEARAEHQRARRGKPGRPPTLEPSPGTRIRAVYDLFMSNPGTPLGVETIYPLINRGAGDTPNPGIQWWRLRQQLAGYGLNIRRHSRGHWQLVVTEATV